MTKKPLVYPEMRCVRQKSNIKHINQLEPVIRKKLTDFKIDEYIKPGETVALTASSRGINNQSLILKIIVEYLKDLKAFPFVIPAMGSHAGATEHGQMQVLHDYGICENSLGCPIKATMEVVEIAKSPYGTPIYIDKHAASADKIIIINKIKTHSKFVGDVESGLTKMCLMGLGKARGAQLYHKLIAHHSWDEISKTHREIILKKVPIICGIGLIQNIYNQTAEIHLLSPDRFKDKEPELLLRYREIQLGIPFKKIDLLIIDEMGKNIFGTGMDTSITGRKPNSEMRVQWLFVRDLTEETHGNAQGIGLADFTTQKVIDKIDRSKTYLNALSAYRTDSAKIPMYFRNDQEVLKEVFNLANLKNVEDFRLIWIRNTLKLERLLVSKYFFEEVSSRDDLTFITGGEQLKFDSDGFLINSKQFW